MYSPLLLVKNEPLVVRRFCFASVVQGRASLISSGYSRVTCAEGGPASERRRRPRRGILPRRSNPKDYRSSISAAAAHRSLQAELYNSAEVHPDWTHRDSAAKREDRMPGRRKTGGSGNYEET
ncbi:uncharacterized protein [Cardiocondyla obscurior]